MATRKDVHIVTRSLDMKLRVLRAERQLSLREASEITGVDKVWLSRLERGLEHPQDRTLAKIAKGYGVPVEELLELEEETSPKAEAPSGRPSPPKEDEETGAGLQTVGKDLTLRWNVRAAGEVLDFLEREGLITEEQGSRVHDRVAEIIGAGAA